MANSKKSTRRKTKRRFTNLVLMEAARQGLYSPWSAACGDEEHLFAVASILHIISMYSHKQKRVLLKFWKKNPRIQVLQVETIYYSALYHGDSIIGDMMAEALDDAPPTT